MLPHLLISVSMGLLCFSESSTAQEIDRIVHTRYGRMEVVLTNGHHQYMATGVASADLKVSPNRRVAAWIRRDASGIADKVFVYRSGQVLSISCAPSTRAFWFVGAGGLIGVDCGGLHFAGREALYSTSSLHKLAEFDQAALDPEHRPGWSSDGITD